MARDRGGLYKSKGVKSKSHFYFLLSIIFLAFMVKWGVPGIINFIASSGSSKKPTNNSIVIPPQKPALSPIREATNSAEISVKGYTTAGVSLELLVDDLIVATANSESDGSFELQAVLEAGSHRIIVRAKDDKGNVSDSDVRIVNYDPSGVEVSIIEPADGSSYFGPNNSVLIKGSVNKENTNVTINGSFTRVEADNSFQKTIDLSDGDNQITVTAVDSAGNQSEKRISLKFSH